MSNFTAKPEPVFAVVYGCILALGLPLNAVALWIFLRRHSLKSTSIVFMVNLALSDLLLSISLPLRVYFFATGTWPYNDTACILTTLLFHNNIRSSCFFITVICIDRLLAVVYPLRSRHLRTPTNAWIVAVLVWLLVVVVNIPEGKELSKYLTNISEPICFEIYSSQIGAKDYFGPVLIFILLAVNVVCTTMVSWTLRRHLKDSVKVKNKVNVMLIFVMNLVMFTICFVPLSVTLLTHEKTDIRPLACLAAANCCLDPLLYYFSLDAFWKKKEEPDLGLHIM